MPGRAVLGEVLEGAALHDDGVGPHDPGIALDERDQVEQAPVAGQARQVHVDLGDRQAEVEHGPDVEGVEDPEVQAGPHGAGAADALRADVGADHVCRVAGQNGCRRAPFAADLKDAIAGADHGRDRLPVLPHASRRDDPRRGPELLLVRHLHVSSEPGRPPRLMKKRPAAATKPPRSRGRPSHGHRRSLAEAA